MITTSRPTFDSVAHPALADLGGDAVIGDRCWRAHCVRDPRHRITPGRHDSGIAAGLLRIRKQSSKAVKTSQRLWYFLQGPPIAPDMWAFFPLGQRWRDDV